MFPCRLVGSIAKSFDVPIFEHSFTYYSGTTDDKAIVSLVQRFHCTYKQPNELREALAQIVAPHVCSYIHTWCYRTLQLTGFYIIFSRYIYLGIISTFVRGIQECQFVMLQVRNLLCLGIFNTQNMDLFVVYN